MEKGSAKKSSISAVTASAFILIVLCFSMLFCSAGIRDWADGLKNHAARTVFYPPAKKLYTFTVKAKTTVPWRVVRYRLFNPMKNAAFAATKKTRNVSLYNQSAPFSSKNPIDILLMGDSLANSISIEFKQSVAANPAVRLEVIAWVSSTLTTPVYFDWPGNIHGIFANKKLRDGKSYDLVIVLMGANDAQGINIDEWTLYYSSPAWLKEFTAREKRFMKTITDNTTLVYWVGIPPMQKEGYRDRMVYINSVYKDITADFKTIQYIPITPYFGDEKGMYTQTKVINGRDEIIRLSDGVHFSRVGAYIVVNLLMNKAQNDFIFEKEAKKSAVQNSVKQN